MYEPIIVDDMASGHEEAVEGFELHRFSLVDDKDKLNELFAKENFDGAIHMAGFIQMGESFQNPLKYFRNNLLSAINLLEAMNKHQVKYLVFSSSAGVYGNPEKLPITENMPRNPVNPYGETKYMVERMLESVDRAHGIKFASII